MVQNIVSPTDGSDTSFRAMERAVHIAKPFDAKIHALAVIPQMTRGSQARTKWEERVKESHDRARELVESENLELTVETLEGPVASRIVQYADEHDVDLIVMGTHGRTGLHRFLVGSVAQRTIQMSSVPVLTVPPAE
ncbi:universal stress protein [Natrialbaceae archaeon AArc-T1-2]|uniref:universal stress protein n=1 Tax=Natrialbaceae archaeon AArc-T1-2 TaxID=3053904 RepID=UPI00255AB7F9|nr:universal stress protein [Natrialbaceae archaeon AArc-T1-2]WIV68244.1 universal stress protein [Natrialbaceae archaeon AArc-T1-2]